MAINLIAVTLFTTLLILIHSTLKKIHKEIVWQREILSEIRGKIPTKATTELEANYIRMILDEVRKIKHAIELPKQIKEIKEAALSKLNQDK